MLDSNVLISIALFKTPNMSRMLDHMLSEHNIIMCDFILNEIIRITHKKFQRKLVLCLIS